MPSFAGKSTHRIMLLIAAFITISLSFAEARQLTEDAKVSVLTCGPGEAIYAIFGHTAIRITDPKLGIDQVYNFGTFDTETPNFSLRFILGKLDYSLSRTSYRYFLQEYMEENRWVREQEVFYNREQKQKIYDYLQESLTGENRRYRYDFFKKNCSTQVIELILEYEDSQVNWDKLKQPATLSFRKALIPYIGGIEWLNLGMNLLLGRPSDAIMTSMESCFIPDRLMEIIEETGLAGAPVLIFDGSYEPKPMRTATTPMIIAWLLFLALVIESIWLKTSKRFSDIVDVILFGFSGLLGLLILFLWWQSDHLWLQRNMNLLWANPLNILLIYSLPTGKKYLTNVILIINIVLVSFLLINFGRVLQTFPQEVMPIAAAMAFRILNRFFKFREKTSHAESLQG